MANPPYLNYSMFWQMARIGFNGARAGAISEYYDRLINSPSLIIPRVGWVAEFNCGGGLNAKEWRIKYIQ